MKRNRNKRNKFEMKINQIYYNIDAKYIYYYISLNLKSKTRLLIEKECMKGMNMCLTSSNKQYIHIGMGVSYGGLNMFHIQVIHAECDFICDKTKPKWKKVTFTCTYANFGLL